MIVQDRGTSLILIRQTDHALLAGFFAREWGNDLFVRPEPLESFRLAAAEHDNGWSEWELFPQIDPATFSPYSFMSVPTEDHMAIYQYGLERLAQVDRYAGLLTSMHCVGLYDRTRATIPGFSSKYVKSSESAVVGDFIQRLRLQQMRLKVELRGDRAMQGSIEEKSLQANLKRFEALDRLSLYFCMASPGDAMIEGVPVDEHGQETDWEIRRAGNVVTVAPYPFRRDPLDVSILAREIPKKRYADDAELQKALASASYFPIEFTMRGAESGVQLRAAAF
ncbi:MAG: hypothetical protein NVS9B4_28150 [Candidatus Acidiferrum sp.]